MTEAVAPVPTDIKLHKKSRLLEISFADGLHFMYPCEYLRVSAPASTEGEGGAPVHGKQRVEITQLEPQGMDALQLTFDDGFSVSYAWRTLHALAENHAHNWQAYLQSLADKGLARESDRITGADGKVIIKLVYFIQLATLTGKDEEEVELPASVTNVETLLTWQAGRRPGWEAAFAPERVQVTVNRHFSEPFTRIEQGDEVAMVPRSTQT